MTASFWSTIFYKPLRVLSRMDLLRDTDPQSSPREFFLASHHSSGAIPVEWSFWDNLTSSKWRWWKPRLIYEEQQCYKLPTLLQKRPSVLRYRLFKKWKSIFLRTWLSFTIAINGSASFTVPLKESSKTTRPKMLLSAHLRFWDRERPHLSSKKDLRSSKILIDNPNFAHECKVAGH